MSSYHQEGDPFNESDSSVPRYDGQRIAVRQQSDITQGDRRLDPRPLGRIERWFGNGAARAAAEARGRADHARAFGELAEARGDAQIQIERMLRADRIGRSQAEAEIAENEARLAIAAGKRERALAQLRNTKELADLDFEIERLKRRNEILRLRQEGNALTAPPRVETQTPPPPSPDHPVIAELKAELGTYERVKQALRRVRRELEESLALYPSRGIRGTSGVSGDPRDRGTQPDHGRGGMNARLLQVGEERRGASPVTLTDAERSTHLHVLGASGAGKSRFLEYLIRQDVAQGRGSLPD